MSIEAVRSYLETWGRAKDIIEMAASTATVPQAAAALGIEGARIAKSISLKAPPHPSPEAPNPAPGTPQGPSGDRAMVVVVAGDMKLDNRKYKDQFGVKAKMLNPEEALALTGHAVGGVCPFALPAGVEVYLDVSLRRFTTVFPACGSGNSAIELTLADLETYSQCRSWVDVCAAITPPA
jgi:prolyl-tRNA editing enzyme YbaK/EbsC (Cys-tRNA(Pro) deacylase)